MRASVYQEVYLKHLECLQAFQKENPEVCEQLQKDLWKILWYVPLSFILSQLN